MGVVEVVEEVMVEERRGGGGRVSEGGVDRSFTEVGYCDERDFWPSGNERARVDGFGLCWEGLRWGGS